MSVRSLMKATSLRPGNLTLLKACPPCQGFSTLGASHSSPERNDLVLDISRFVRGLRPKAVLIENVVGLRRDRRFPALLADLLKAGYAVAHYVLDARSYGVPQRRRRLVIVAIRGGRKAILPAREDMLSPANQSPPLTAGDALNDLHRDLVPDDPWHRWRRSSAEVMRRIASVPVGGSRYDLPEPLWLPCHRSLALKMPTAPKAATASYGRVLNGEPAPTMTTRCTTPACGPFIHPTEPRGLSLREAAAFQTFPSTYKWSGGYDSVERQIGNAVPVRMAEQLALRLLERLTEPRSTPPAHRSFTTTPVTCREI